MFNKKAVDIKEKSDPLPPSQFSAWVASWDQDKALLSVEQSSNKLKYLSPVWYSLDAKGGIKPVAGIWMDQFKTKAKDLNIGLIPTIFNQFDAERVSLLISNPQLYTKFSNQTVTIAQEKGYLGWDIDFEGIKLKDRDKFNEFIRHLAQDLHQNGLLLSVSVHAQTGNNDWEAALAQDWKQISQQADFIRIMAYDFHNQNTPPGPITPLDKYELVLKNATSQIPVNKIVIGLPLYGYDWEDKKGTPVTYLQIDELKRKKEASPTRDPLSQALTLSYQEGKTNHTVWVEDSQSTQYKINKAKEFKIYQFSFWKLGGEDPTFWQIIK